VIAKDVPVSQHIAIQAAFQKHTDNAVSKTINMPSDATVDDVAKAYRDGSRKGQIIQTRASNRNNGDGVHAPSGNGDAMVVTMTLPEQRQRPMVLSGETYKLPIGCKNIYVTVNNDKAMGTPYEMFVRAQKPGSCIESQNQALGRAVSIGLRYGVPAEAYVKQLQDIKCSRPCISGGISTSSCSDAVAKVLMMHLGMDPNGRDAMAHQTGLQEACPDCGRSPLVHESGCVHCAECGFERCS
jgi:ribonucleoside-diphosphate reductase alpha chain